MNYNYHNIDDVRRARRHYRLQRLCGAVADGLLVFAIAAVLTALVGTFVMLLVNLVHQP